MKKTITILSVVAAIIAFASLFLAIGGLVAFWKPMCSLFSYPQEVMDGGPVMPIGNLLYMIGCLVVATIACSRAGKAVAMDVLLIALLCVVVPGLAWIAATVQSTVLGYSGTYEVIALGAANNVTGLARGLTSVSASLSLVVCGISIAEKVRMKKEAAAAEAEKVVQ